MTKHFMLLFVLLLTACGVRPESTNDQAITVWKSKSWDARLEKLVDQQISIEIKKKTPKQIRNCEKLRSDFQTAGQLTGQSPDLLLALATIESGGCTNTVRADGKAIGVMQIAKSDDKHLRQATQLLKVQTLDPEHIPLHNIVLGAVMLHDYTNRFGNIADGLEAYNQGPGKVERFDHSDFPNYVLRVLATARLVRQ